VRFGINSLRNAKKASSNRVNVLVYMNFPFGDYFCSLSSIVVFII